MAEQYGILVAGQSQGNLVGELAWFEAQAPATSVRRPDAGPKTPTVSRSFTQDTYTLPGVWPERYRNFRLRGRATTAVMRLAQFNPVSTYFEMQDVGSGAFTSHFTSAFPGYAASFSQPGSDTAKVELACAFQDPPSGLVVVREGTGTSHIIGPGWSSASPGLITLLSSDPTPHVPGEIYKLPLQCYAVGTNQTIPTNVRFGGYHDGGSLLEAALLGGTTATLGGHVVQPYPVTIPGSPIGAPVELRCPTRHMRVGQRLRFTTTGSLGDLVATTTDYWVARVDNTAGSPKFYVTTNRGGSEVLSTGAAPSGTQMLAVLPQSFDATMAGTRVRWTSGTMAGLAFDLDDCELVSAAPTDHFHLKTLEVMPFIPQIGDTFEIEPQQINNEDVGWQEFQHFVPECRMQGPASTGGVAVAHSYAAVTPGTAVTFQSTLGAVFEGMRIGIYDYYNLGSTAITPAPTSGSFQGAGQTLYAVNVDYAAGSYQVATSYGGTPIADATLAAGFVTVFQLEHPDRGNPMPPGFNFDNASPIPESYQPYFGNFVGLQRGEPGATFTTSLALAMHEKLGRPLYLVHANVGGTALARREVSGNSVAGVAHGGFDPKVLLDWSPSGEVDNCYARLVTKLECAKRAAAALGHTLKIVGVFFPQGETDTTDAAMLARYPDNIRAFVAAVRAKIVELGLWDGPAETIPWWQPQLPTSVGGDWGMDGYASNVAFNEILTELAEEDPYFVTRALPDAVVGYDGIHYSGGYQWTLGLHAFADWATIAPSLSDRTRIDICNQALKNVGETKAIQSLTEDSAAARLCLRYYPVASRTLLESFAWQFATKTQTLVQVANSRADLDWQYAYRLPSNFLSVVGLGPDAAGAVVRDEIEHSIEGSVLYCNLSAVTLRYTSASPDPADYSQHYTNALAHQLAAEIAPALAQGDKGAALAQAQMQLANYYTDLAKEHTAQRLRHSNPSAQSYAWD